MSYHFGCDERNSIIYILPQKYILRDFSINLILLFFFRKITLEKLHYEDLHILLVLEFM